MARNRLLLVNVALGMFPDEYAVTVETAEAQLISMFVPRDMVRDVDGEPADENNGTLGKIRVEELECDDSFCLVSLPLRSLEGPRTVKVPVAALA